MPRVEVLAHELVGHSRFVNVVEDFCTITHAVRVLHALAISNDRAQVDNEIEIRPKVEVKRIVLQDELIIGQIWALPCCVVQRDQFIWEGVRVVLLGTVDAVEVVKAIDGLNPGILLGPVRIQLVNVKLRNQISAEVGHLHGGVVVVFDHHKGHEGRAVEVLAVVLRRGTVQIIVDVDIAGQRLSLELIELRVSIKLTDNEEHHKHGANACKGASHASLVIRVAQPVERDGNSRLVN